MASTTTERERPRRRFVPPADVAVEPYRVTQRLTLRVAVLSVLVLVVFAALFLRLWALQVLAGAKYVNYAQANSYRTVRVQAPRGPILDRNGRALVLNEPSQAVQLYPHDLPKVYVDRYAELKRISQVTQVPLYEIAAGIKRRAGDPLTPVIVRDDASTAMVAYLYEHQSEFPGVTVGRSYIRHYPYHSLAAQVLGYVGEISPAQLKSKAKSGGYAAGDEIGQSGVEATYDTYLRGVAGSQRLHVDSLNRPQGSVITTAWAKPGQRVRLTIDLNLQKAAEKALQSGIQLARNNGQWAASGGAIVALDPSDGSVLALASSPSYEPSVFAGRVSERRLAAQGLTYKSAPKKNYPALDRALVGEYPPGSVFKPVTALAAMEQHKVLPYAYLPCTGSYVSKYDKAAKPQQFHNWDPNVNQQMDLPTALAYSCDTYFYQLGDLFYNPTSSKQPLQQWARAFGFGSTTGSDLGPEAAGLVPTIGWRKRTYTPKTDPGHWQVDSLWKPGDSIQLAIGQKDLLVTPIQMARFYALIANGGKLVTPHVLMDVEDSNGTAVPVAALPAPKSVGVDPAALNVVKQGLWEGTHLPFGTSYGVFGTFPVSIAGKTGTAEKVVTLPGYRGVQNQSWWCGYGPTGDPKIVVCAVIENGGHGGTAAAPAAMQVFAKFFHVKAHLAAPIHSD